MAITNNLTATLSLNTLGGDNSPQPEDSYNSTVAIGTYAAGPITQKVTSTPTLLPMSGATPAGPATAVYCLMVAHTGSSSDPSIVLDMSSGSSSKVTIAPGGRIYFYNCVIALTGSNLAHYGSWTLSTASSTTTAAVALVYT